jgi:tetratricopeptide (TPR) repeat protein
MLKHYLAKAAGACLLALLPATGLALGASSAPQQPSQQAPAGKKTAPQAKSKEEYEAFVAASGAPTAEAAEAAASGFEAKYPKSELLSLLYQQVMAKYEQADNTGKTVAMGRKALHYDPDNVDALVLTSMVVAESTRDTDIDLDDRLKEITDDATRALRLMESGNFYLGAAVTPNQVQAFKDMVSYMANAALGQASLLKKQDAAAEQQFRKALATKQGSEDPLTWLRLSYALEHLGKNSDALNAANKAAALAPPNSPTASLAKQEQDRLKQLSH